MSRNYQAVPNKTPLLAAPHQRLAIEVPPPPNKGNHCNFHLTLDHDGATTHK